MLFDPDLDEDAFLFPNFDSIVAILHEVEETVVVTTVDYDGLEEVHTIRWPHLGVWGEDDIRAEVLERVGGRPGYDHVQVEWE